jgi:4-hydroxy-2-oxoheptanedioate aldolase
MIESPAGVDIVDKLAAMPGVDVIFAASTDLMSFTGLKQGDPRYEALVSRVRDTTLKNGKIMAGPLAWKDRPGYNFFQGPGETSLIRTGARIELGSPTGESRQKGVAPTEGAEK